jgi:CheY-like chemotaxis protein
VREVPFSALPKEVQERVVNNRREREELRRMGIRINYVKPVLHQGHKVWALGSRVHFTGPKITFHEFTIGILSSTLQTAWWDEQRTLSSEEQHFLTRCFDEYARWKTERHEEVRPGIYAGDPNGYVQHLASVAFDVATLTHTQSLPGDLVRRLRHHDQYQGARYEIGIAAIFSRLDFELHFITREEAQGKPHPEFVATSRHSGLQVAVEVKSKHRAGVINQPGDFDEQAVRANVGRQLHEAVQQNPGGIPFMIFIDVNVPPTSGLDIMQKPWLRDISEILGLKQPFTAEGPDPVSAVVLTNYAQHYEAEARASAGEHVISTSQHVVHPLPLDFLTDMNDALSAYGNVPNFDVEP